MVEGNVTLVPSAGRPPWIFVVGRAFLAALPLDTDDAIVQAVMAFAPQASVDLESMVTLLPQSGAGSLASFALVVPESGAAGTGVSVLVRGSLAVDIYSVGGSRRFSAGGILPWLLADFQAVTGIVISDGTEPARALEPGTIVAGALRRSGGGLIWLVDEPAWDDTVLVSPSPDASIAGSDTVAGRGAAGADTIVLPASPRRHDDRTAEPPVRGGEARPRYSFLLDGAAYRLDGRYYLGRRPRTPRTGAVEPLTLLAVPSPTRSVSGTHLEIRQEGDAVVVTDLGSTNGTLLLPPAGHTERLRQGTSRTVVPGTRVDIGDGNIVEILPVSGDASSLPSAKNRKAQP